MCQCFENNVGGVRQIVLVWNATAGQAEQDPELRALADALWRRHGPGSPAPLLHSVWANAQPGRGNTIFGADWLPLRRLPDTEDPVTWQVLCMTGIDAVQMQCAFIASQLAGKHVKASWPCAAQAIRCKIRNPKHREDCFRTKTVAIIERTAQVCAAPFAARHLL